MCTISQNKAMKCCYFFDNGGKLDFSQRHGSGPS